jgi:hypothetical protein
MDDDDQQPTREYGILANRETRQPVRMKAVVRESEESQSRWRCIFVAVGPTGVVELANFRIEQN